MLVGGTTTPALAAAGCVTADTYQHHELDPGKAAASFVSGAKFGAATVIGDFNRDGFGDVAVGAPADSAGGVASGAVYVFLGSANGVSTGTRLTETNIGAGNESGDQFGASLAAGDFNKDGFVDLAVGIPGEAIGSLTKAGAIGVFNGSSTGLSSGTFMDESDDAGGNEASDTFGTALAAGDLNGDGYADLAVGTPGEAPSGTTTRSGWAYVLKGSSGGLTAGWTANQGDADGSNEAGDEFGAAVAIGNVTGDSHADLVVGAPGEAPGSDPANSGAFYVIPGAADGKGTGGVATFQSTEGAANEAGDRLGAALAVGDFDHDGKADIAAGVPGEAPDSDPAGGSILVVPGASSGLGAGYAVQESNAGQMIATGDRFGNALAAADTNGDSYADLLVGAPGRSYGTATGAGTAFLYDGGPRISGSTTSLKFGRRIGQTDVNATNESNDAFGSAVALGDITGDGNADGVIGSSGEAVPGHPASGTANQIANLAPPASPAFPVEQYPASNAMQASLASGASVQTIEYTYTDNIGRVLHGHQTDPNNFNSVQWTTISGLDAYSGKPGLAERADGLLQITAHNTTSDFGVDTETSKSPATWGPFSGVSGSLASNATLVHQSDGTNVAFAVDANGDLLALRELGANGRYTAWINLGVTGLVGQPVAVVVSSGVQVFAMDATGDLKTALYTNDLLSGCTSLNGTGLTGTPSVVVFPGSRIRVFVRAADGTIQTQMQNIDGTFPGTWDQVSTMIAAGSPSAVLSPSTGTAEVVARDSNGLIWSSGEVAQGSGTWRDWAQVNFDGDLAATDPTAFTYTNANGQTWALVFRRSDQTSRVYNVSNNTLLSATVTGEVTSPSFTGQSLPTPPKSQVHPTR